MYGFSVSKRMGRIVAIDYGRKRCGVAVTDPLRLSVNPKPTVAPSDLQTVIRDLYDSGELDTVVLTRSQHADGSDNPIQADIYRFAERLQKAYPALQIDYQDEFASSKEAMQHLISSGVRRQKRAQPGQLDAAAAGIILERYLRDSGIW